MRIISALGLVLLLSSGILAAEKTWDGGGADANWQTPANWVGDAPPAAGDDLVFPAAAGQFTATNNFPILTNFNSIRIEGGTYTLGGNLLRIGAGGLNVAAGTQTINIPITLSAAQTFATGDAATVTIAVASLGSFSLTFDGAGIAGIGLISGTGPIVKNGPGGAGLLASAGYSGPITVNNGVFVVDASLPNSQITVNSSTEPGGPLGFSGFGGTGTVGATTVNQGIISSGTLTSLTGVLNISGGLTFTPNGAYACKVAGTTPGANGHDQLNVTGSVTLNNAVFLPVEIDDFVPPVGTTLVVLRNDGTDPVNGTFFAAPEGSVLVGALGERYRISYRGGDGNDITITRVNLTSADFDGDGRSDLSVFRPGEGNWYLKMSGGGISVFTWGVESDRIVPGDYDGDGKADAAVFRPSNSTWYIINSRDYSISVSVWGESGDIPVPADYDGDQRTDIAVYRPSTNTWFLKKSTEGFYAQVFGAAGDVPVPADHDGDARADIAIFRTGSWYIAESANGGVMAIRQHGQAGDKPVPADYDGDGRADLAVFRPAAGLWDIRQSLTSASRLVNWGIATDTPVPGDYDADGRADPAVYRDGTWFLNRSTEGLFIGNWGVANDRPAPAGYLP